MVQVVHKMQLCLVFNSKVTCNKLDIYLETKKKKPKRKNQPLNWSKDGIMDTGFASICSDQYRLS